MIECCLKSLAPLKQRGLSLTTESLNSHSKFPLEVIKIYLQPNARSVNSAQILNYCLTTKLPE